MKNTIFNFLSLLLMGFLIVGCGKKEEPKTAGFMDALSGTSSSPISTPTAEPLVDERTPKGNPSTPDSAYVLIKDPIQLVSQEVALMPPPMDYERIAKALSLKYEQTGDNFKKKDMLTDLKPKINELIQGATRNHYVILTLSPSLDEYDFSKKTFKISTFGDEGKIVYSNSENYNNQATIDFSNKKKFQYLTVENEAVARKIEEMRSSSNFNDDSMKIFMFIQKTHKHASNTSPYLIAEIMKVKITEKNGDVIFESK